MELRIDPVQQALDQRVMARVRAGDPQAEDELYRMHAPAAIRRAIQHGSQPADAEDFVHEAFVRVLGQLRRGQGPTGSFRPYLIAAVRNVAVDAWRGTLGRELPTGESWAVAVGGEASTDPQDEIEIRFAVQRVMADLPPQWRYILWRLDHQGDTPAGVASEVGASAQAVSALAYRARRAFRGAYQELGLRDAVAGDDPDAAVAPHPRALRYEETATAICS